MILVSQSFFALLRLKDQCRQRGAQRQRIEGREQSGERNRQCELFVKLSGDPADKCNGNEIPRLSQTRWR